MNTATNDETKTKTVSHNGVNGRNGSHNGRTAIHELPILGAGGAQSSIHGGAAEAASSCVSETPGKMRQRRA